MSLPDAHTQHNQSLLELSEQQPLLVVFLRHGGCPFCREMLSRLQRDRREIEQQGVRIVLIHMMTDDEAGELFAHYGLENVDRVSDPRQRLYAGWGVARGMASQVMGPHVWWQGFKTTVLQGHWPGRPRGDVLQLQGAFLVYKREILSRFEPRTSAEQADYVDLASCPVNRPDSPHAS